LVVKSYFQLLSALSLKSQLPNSMFQRNSLSLKSCATPSLSKIPHTTELALCWSTKQSHPHTIQQSYQLQLNELMIKYKDRFEGLGKLKDVKLKVHTKDNVKLKVHTKDSVTPVAQKARRLPFLMKQQVDKEIHYLLELKVIEPVPKPPTWINHILVVPKKDSSNI